MRFITRFLIFIIILGAIAYLGLFIFVNIKGKEIVKETIKKNFGLEAEIGSLYLKPPFILEIGDFTCGDVSFGRATVWLRSFNPFIPLIDINNLFIKELNLNVKRYKEKISIAPFFIKRIPKPKGASPLTKKTSQTPFATESEEEYATFLKDIRKGYLSIPKMKGEKIHFKINNLSLRQSSIKFTDYTLKPPLDFVLKNIKLKLKNFYYPELTKFNIDLTADFKKGNIETEDIIKIDGWVDYYNKNMDCDLSLKEINYLAFKEHYPSSWKPESLEIKETLLSLDSNLNSKNNDLAIAGTLTLEKIEFQEKQTEEPTRGDTIRTVLALFKKDDYGRPILQFSQKTKMDSPKLDFSFLKRQLAKDIPGGLLNVITEGVIGEVKEAISDVLEGTKKATVDETKETIEDVLDKFKDIFKKEIFGEE